MKIYRIYYDSRNFSFEVFSDDLIGGTNLLIAGLEKHGEQYGLDSSWFDLEGIEWDEYEIAKVYRDREEV